VTVELVDGKALALNNALMSEKPGFKRHIHYFRAVAILFVVISHVFLPPWIHTGFRHPVFSLGFLFFTNATVLFVLISGFLFQYINDNPGFRYGALMRKKFLFIYVPMLVMSLPALLLGLFATPGVSLKKVMGAALALPAGLLVGPYWYIPFIMLVFAASPLIRKFIRLRGASVITVVTIAVCFFLFPRTFSLWPSVVPYFVPLFVLGATMSYHYEHIQGRIARAVWLWGLFALAYMAASIVVPYAPPRYVAKHLNVSILAGVQSVCSGFFKVFLALFFWGLLIKCEHWKSRFLDLFATYSFGIYFVHSYFLMVGLVSYSTLWPPAGPLSISVTFAYCFIVPLVSLGIAMLVKLAIPRYSRYVAGV